MNITRLNYTQTLPLIRQAIQESHFLSFDLEMSGILTEELTSPSIVDSIQIRYEKQKQSINKFVPLQFGLSAFKVDPHQNKIWVSPFNFYIFPLALNNDTMKFSFHAGTMNFLTKNNFDFNKLFYESIPYTSNDRLNRVKKDEQMIEFKRQLRKTKLLQSPETKAFVSLKLPLVQQWLVSDCQLLEIDIKMVKYQSYMILKQKIQELHPEVPLLFEFDSELIYLRTKMIIKKCTAEQKPSQEVKIQQQSTEDMLFNKVMDQIVTARRPLIIHNGFLDLMHVYYRLFSDLPQDWNTYRIHLKNLFPAIYDNKYLFASSPTLSSYTEESCYLGVRRQEEKVKNKNDPSFMQIQMDPYFTEYNFDNLECHEAGFDSLMTGYSFLRGVTLLNTDSSLLTNSKLFAEEYRLIRNRIPQGSIKVPFNLQNQGEDIYSKDGNSPIHFKSVLHQATSQQAIQQYFSSNFGAINFLWTVRDMSEFCIIFLNEKDQNNFENHLTKVLGASSSIIFEIGKIKYLVLSNMDQHALMKNCIKSQIEENQSLAEQIKKE